jgi:geranylgeranyl diphosphate synthase type II
MDRSRQRRGGPSMSAQYQDLLEGDDFTTKDSEHMGGMVAFNVGLLAMHMSARVLGAVDAPKERVTHAGDIFHRNLLVTGAGQIDDLMHGAGQPVTGADIRRMYEQKTGYYTFVNPLQTGAALAGASTADLRLLREYGIQAGVAFQIRDDIIGMFGVEQETGKSPLDDLREGKLTLMMQYALDAGTPAEREVLEAALGNPAVTPEQHTAVCETLERMGARVHAEDEARVAAVGAQAVLDGQPQWDLAARGFLGELLRYVVNRNV